MANEGREEVLQLYGSESGFCGIIMNLNTVVKFT